MEQVHAQWHGPHRLAEIVAGPLALGALEPDGGPREQAADRDWISARGDEPRRRVVSPSLGVRSGGTG